MLVKEWLTTQLPSNDVVRPPEGLGRTNGFIEVLKNLIEKGKTQQYISGIFGVSREAISKRVSRDTVLKMVQSTKTYNCVVNEIIEGKTQSEIAESYDVTQARISQIWGDFKNELENTYNCGKTPYLTLFYYFNPSI